MNDERVSILSLPEASSYDNLWVPGSTKNDNGDTETFKYPLTKFIERVQLERRIPCVFERPEYSYLNPEDTTLYKCLLDNVSSLQYSLDKKVTWKDVVIGANGVVNITLPANTVVWFKAERKTLDVIAYTSFFGRAKIDVKSLK